MQNTLWPVILSAAKNLGPPVDRPGSLEILRCAQNDRPKPLFHGVAYGLSTSMQDIYQPQRMAFNDQHRTARTLLSDLWGRSRVRAIRRRALLRLRRAARSCA